jgi:3-hydroxybutyrate dehydrogenase/3-oxoacyl-[acyl-carrier protein] reductase
MLDAGASVAIMGRSAGSGEKALVDLAEPERTLFVAGDASSREMIDEFVDATTERFGGIDVLVNNAGGGVANDQGEFIFEPVDQMSDDTWNRTLAFNLSSAFWATRRALPSMIKSGGGRIINISGVLGKQGGMSGVSGYIASKHGLNGFTRAVATEYGPQGITCNSICPGHMETDAMRSYGAATSSETGVSYEQALKPFTEQTLLKRLTNPEDVAALAVLLASSAGSGITGALLDVDAGILAW